MIKLPEVHTMKKDINELTKQIQLVLYTLPSIPRGRILLTTSFYIKFDITLNTDIYCVYDTLYIPLMSIEKANNLPKFLSDIGYPRAFHHEACHLLDLNFIREYNLSYTEEELEERAEHAEHKVLY